MRGTSCVSRLSAAVQIAASSGSLENVVIGMELKHKTELDPRPPEGYGQQDATFLDSFLRGHGPSIAEDAAVIMPLPPWYIRLPVF
jgi:hypothetical protein